MSKERPEAIKDGGNALFAKGEYKQAIEFYTRAVKLLDKISNLSAEQKKLKAVCLSNQAACLFETGSYKASIRDSNLSLELLENEDEETLRNKNLLRMGRASFHLANFDDCRSTLESLTATCNSEAYKKRAIRMLKQLAFYTTH